VIVGCDIGMGADTTDGVITGFDVTAGGGAVGGAIIGAGGGGGGGGGGAGAAAGFRGGGPGGRAADMAGDGSTERDQFRWSPPVATTYRPTTHEAAEYPRPCAPRLSHLTPMADKESSVLFSLQELMNLEHTRIREEQEAQRAQREAAEHAKVEAARRAREDEETRLRDEQETRRREEVRRRMDDAHIEASKLAAIEAQRLAEHHRLQMEVLSKQQEHERAIQQIEAGKRRGPHPGVLAAIGVALLAALVAIVFFVAIKPANDASAAIKRAEVAAASDDPSQWDEADRQLAIARDKAPTHQGIAPLTDSLRKKRDDLQAKKDAAAAEVTAELKKLKSDIAAAEKKLSDAKTQADKDAAAKDLAIARGKLGGGGGGGGAVVNPNAGKICKEVPGCPLCPKVCN